MAVGGLGDAWIDVHANTDPFDREVDKGLQKGLQQASQDADQLLKNMGHGFGKKLADSTEEELGKHGHDFVKAVEDSTNLPFDFKGAPRRFNRDRLGRFAKTIVGDLENEVEKAFTSSDSQGFFAKIGGFFGKGIQDAIGSISGTPSGSPLALIIGPAIGALVGLIIGAIQAVNGLLAVLTLMPAALAAIGLQAGTLLIVFHGLSGAIGGVFAAKNWQEVRNAVKDLTPAAQEFVISLLPLKALLKSIQDLAQSKFFTALGTTVTLVAQTLGPIFRSGFGMLAQQLGYFFFQLGHFFASPVFIKFVSELFPATARWIGNFGPTFIRILDSITKIATTSLPYLSVFGDFLVRNLDYVASILDKMSKKKDFQQWLADGLGTLTSIFELIGQTVQFVTVLLDDINKAGGRKVIDQISDSIEKLTTLLASPMGQMAIQELIKLSILLLQIFTGLIALIIIILGGMQELDNKIQDFFDWLTGKGKKAAGDIKHTADSIAGFFTSIPDKVLNAFKNFGSLLYNAGRDLLMGLIHGIESMIKPLTDKLSFITRLIPSWKGPEDKDRKLLEPAGVAVMQGFGAGITKGAKDVMRMMSDYTNDIGGLRLAGSTGGVNFGPGAIRLTFAGALPTEQQATGIGRAVGNGINDRLAERDTVLAVRTL